MKIKKLISIGLCTCLSFAMAAPAFAADPTTVLTATYKEPVIKVDVPKTGLASINPYGLPYQIGTDEGDNPITIKNQQIAGAPLALVNRTDVDLDVKASVEAKAKGNFIFSKSAPTTSIKTTSAQVYLEATPVAITNEQLSDDTTKEIILAKAAAAWEVKTPSDAEKIVVLADTSGTTTSTEGATVEVPGVESKKAIVTLGKATISGGETQVNETNGVALFRLSGVAVKAPTTPATGWATTDGLEASITFTFEPAAT